MLTMTYIRATVKHLRHATALSLQSLKFVWTVFRAACVVVWVGRDGRTWGCCTRRQSSAAQPPNTLYP
jgi:hypothetical protein